MTEPNELSRYDRQLRLWGSLGQTLLDKAHICIIGPNGALLQETLRNLVLLGVSNFTWHELKRCNSDGEDLFYKDTLRDIGLLRPDEININFVSATLKIDDYSNFNLIIQLQVSDNQIKSISTNVPPILTAKTSSFYGYVKLKLIEPHMVLDPHNEYPKPDLRIADPWPELKEYMESYTIDIDHANAYPYNVLLYKVLEHLNGKNMGINTKSIKQGLKDLCGPQLINNHYYEGLNYLEAQRFAFRATSKQEHEQFLTRLDENILPYVLEQQDKNKGKWSEPMNRQICMLLVELSQYMKEEDLPLPLQGDYPDMECDHNEYQKLKRIYDHFRTSYLNGFVDRVHKIDQSITREVLEIFCKTVMDINIIKPVDNDTNNNGSGAETSELYEILSGTDPLHSTTRRCGKFKSIMSKSTLFSTEVFIAGLVSQEAIKLITHQFIPIDNTFIYDGLTGEHTKTIKT